jgi:hypothetical protein
MRLLLLLLLLRKEGSVTALRSEAASTISRAACL